VNVADYVAQLTRDGELLAVAAERAGWDAPVPGLDWAMRDLVTHVGGVHRWAEAIVRTASPTLKVAEGAVVGSGPADDELLSWFRSGLAMLIDTLSAAPGDLECAAFLPAPDPLTFWARRQAHETAVHRSDAEAALGARTPVDAAFAADGMDELLLGFAARRREPPALAGVVALECGDAPSWRVRMGGERIVAERAGTRAGGSADDGADSGAGVRVRGGASDLYLWLWNRPADVTIEGEPALAEQWREVRVTWS
jgi:uncharacterized protein (TIGR03083 family)